MISSEKNDSKFNTLKHLKSKNYEITSKKPHISSNQRLFNNTNHICPNFSKTFNRDFVEFIRQNHSIFNNSCNYRYNTTNPPQCTPYSWRAFQLYQKHRKAHRDLGYLSLEQNKQMTLCFGHWSSLCVPSFHFLFGAFKINFI